VGYGCVPPLGAAFTAANAGGSTTIVAGVTIKGNDTTWGDALAAAASADAIVLALGTDRSVACEGTDLRSTSLPGVQSEFARAVVAAAKKGAPIVFLLVSSFPIAFDELVGDMDAVVLGARVLRDRAPSPPPRTPPCPALTSPPPPHTHPPRALQPTRPALAPKRWLPRSLAPTAGGAACSRTTPPPT